MNANENDDYVAEEDFDEFDEEDDDDGQGGSKALTKKLEELKKQALEKFDTLRGHFDRMRKAYEKEGYKSPAYNRAQMSVSAEISPATSVPSEAAISDARDSRKSPASTVNTLGFCASNWRRSRIAGNWCW